VHRPHQRLARARSYRLTDNTLKISGRQLEKLVACHGIVDQLLGGRSA
jgi:hypothetical protein